tara:strand:- start:163 stop:765 length:603 start_codon:yes stop_codon:yes gene_type:complete
MSVRSETRDLSANMQQALTISPEVMRTAAQESGAIVPVDTAGQADHLNPANEFNTSNPEHPLKRTVVVNIRASLNDLCLKKARATWQPPNGDATKAIFQQRKFVDLQGTSEAQGNLKSIVLHKMSLTSQRNTFPIGENNCPAHTKLRLTAPPCARSAGRPHLGCRRLHLLADGRGVLRHRAAQRRRPLDTCDPGGRHGAR